MLVEGVRLTGSKALHTMQYGFLLFFCFLHCSLNAQIAPDWELLLSPFPANTEIALATYENGQVHFQGYRKERDSIVAVSNQQSIFRIGSISKTFTSQLLAAAIANEVVNTNDQLGQLLPFEVNESLRKITLEQLANHTSGLPRMPSSWMAHMFGGQPFAHVDTTEIKHLLQTGISLESQPGEKYLYSNVGVGLLAYTLVQSLDFPYEYLLSELITTPHGLLSTSSAIVDSTRWVQGQNPAGVPISPWEFADFFGVGDIWSTTEDMAKYLKLQLETNTGFQFAHEETFRVKEDLALGLGWHIIDPEQEHPIWLHDGGTLGYRAFMAFQKGPVAKGIILLSNVSAFHHANTTLDKAAMQWMRQ